MLSIICIDYNSSVNISLEFLVLIVPENGSIVGSKIRGWSTLRKIIFLRVTLTECPQNLYGTSKAIQNRFKPKKVKFVMAVHHSKKRKGGGGNGPAIVENNFKNLIVALYKIFYLRWHFYIISIFKCACYVVGQNSLFYLVCWYICKEIWLLIKKLVVVCQNPFPVILRL